MNAHLCFTVFLQFQRTAFEELKQLGVCNAQGHGLFAWTFPISALSCVKKILAGIVEFDADEAKVVILNCPPLKELVNIDEWKGVDEVIVSRLPDAFKITSHRKIESDDGAKVVEVVNIVPIESVQAAWNVVRQQPLHKSVSSRTVAENIVSEELGFTRFNRESGSFDWAKFFGNRREYMCYFYFPIKILSWYGVIIHHKRGSIERVCDKWSLQSTLY